MSEDFESGNIIETVKPRKGVIDFLTMDSEAMAIFRDQITMSNGIVRILVHPFFDLDDTTKMYEETTRRLLASHSTQGLPIVVLQEGGSKYLEGKEKVLAMMSEELGGKIYFVPTFGSHPEPNRKYNGVFEWSTHDSEEDRLNWKALTDKLKDAGVERCLVGGQYFQVEKYNYGIKQNELKAQFGLKGFNNMDSNYVTGCVGGASAALAREGIGVEISSIAAPDRRSHVISGKKKID